MSNRSEENARFVTCRCQHCDGPIEFDANELSSPLGAKVLCPHCAKETWIFDTDSTRDSSVSKSKPFNRRVVIPIVTSVAGILLIGVIVFVSEPTHTLKDFFLLEFGLVLMAVTLCGAVALYFLPSILAWKKKKVNRVAIFILNLSLGWTFIGWIVALIWAAAQDDRI